MNQTLGGITGFLPLILIIVIMYFLLIRPQKKREKEVNAMREALRPGDKIITIGGIYGTILRIKDNNLVIQVGADKTKLDIARWAVSNVLSDDMTERMKAEKAEPEKEEPAAKARPKRLEKTAAAKPEATEPASTPEAPREARLDQADQKNPLEDVD